MKRNLRDRLDSIESMLQSLLEQQTTREWYTTKEIAKRIGKAEYTVREYARLGRISASKRRSGRGKHLSWVVSHVEYVRLQRDGLLPTRKTAASLEAES